MRGANVADIANSTQPVWIDVLGAANSGEAIQRFQYNSEPPYQPAGLVGSTTDPTFIAANSTISGVGGVLSSFGLCQGLACHPNGTLAASDGPVIWLFDAATGGFAGAGAINLSAWGNLFAYTLAFGPDGNLYVLAAPPVPSPEEAYPSGVQVLRFLSTTAIPWGVNNGNPVLITAQQLNNSGGTAMTVGGSAQAPIVYLSLTNNSPNSSPDIQTFSAPAWTAIASEFPAIEPATELISLDIVDY